MKDKRPKFSFPVLWGVFVLFILPGLSVGLYGTVMWIVSSNWTPVEATIGDAYINHTKVSRIRSSKPGRNRESKKSVRRLQLNYIYLWGGDTVSSDRIAFLHGYSDRQINKGIIAQRLKEGEKVIAYVNPRNPQKAVLVRAIHDTILFGYVSAVSCFLFFSFIGGVLFCYPSYKWGWRSLAIMVALYIVYFGVGIDRSVLSLIKFVS